MTVSMWLVMTAAVLASLAAGVLAAYGICTVMFHIFRIHARQMRAERQLGTEPAATQLQA